LVMHFPKKNKESTIWEQDKIKPTYRILKEDPLPYFFSKHYPYTKLDLFDSKPTPVKYKEIVMENEYLQLTFIPELGARLFSAFDKISQYHIFHYNETIRPSLLAQRGAWIAVGIEFNLSQFPAHTADNFSPVDYAYKRNEDGSISILFGNLMLYNNIRYLVIVTLRPKTSRIETEVRTLNTDLIPQRYYFWSNAGVTASTGLCLFYPGSLSTRGKYPINENGIDLSWYKNYDRAADCFILDSEEDFFATYNYDNSRGIVHYANHQMVPGKKFFTWGVSADGLFWKDILSDKGLPYIEMQSGRFLTQYTVEFIEPLTFESWMEYWYPIRNISGVTYANDKVCLYAKQTKEKGNNLLRVEICSAITCTEARLELCVDGEKFYEEPVKLSPEKTVSKEIKTPSGKLLLKIVDSQGNEIISWDFRKYKTKAPDERALGDSSEELWLKGIDAEKKKTRFIAKRFFERSLKKDGRFSRSLCSIGLICYRSGLYEKAIENFKKALQRDPRHEDSRYYLGLTMLTLGRYEDAERELWKLCLGRRYRTLAFYLLGIIKMRLGAYNGAMKMFRKSIQEYSFNLKSLSMLSIALRKQGKNEEALEIIEKAYDMMPLDYLVLAEKYFLSSNNELERVVFTDFQKVLEVSKDYIFAGLFEEAFIILKAALDKGISNPMIYYYIGYVLSRMGRLDDAIKYYRKGGAKNLDYVFPHRLIEISILEDAIKKVPSSPVPYYLLGNVLFYKGRFEEGLKKWEKAYELGLKNAVLCRNIGYARSILTNDIGASIDMYLNAIKIDPKNHKLYIELHDVYSRIGRFTEAIKILENAPKEAKQDRLLARLASAYIDVGEYDRALDILLNAFFEPMEAYYGFWDIYVNALMAKGLTLFKNNKMEEAVKCFIDATKYPPNLGPTAPHPKYRRDVMQLYYAGLAYEKLGDILTAQKIWSDALQRNPELTDEHSVFKGLILKKMGRKEESDSLIKKIISETESRMNRMLEEIGDEKGCSALLHRVSWDKSYADEFAYLHYVKGIAHIARGRKEEGLNEINKALEITEAVRDARWIKERVITI